MTSKCSQSASATRCDSSASRAKSADSRLGAISGSRGTGPESTEDLRGGLTLPVLRDLDLTGGVAVRLSSLCLDYKGRLRDFALWDDAARGALLVDLTRTGRLGHDEESVTVDGSPTAFEPADRLLAAIAVEPEHSLDWWMRHGGVGMRDLAEANVASGRWVVRPRLLGRRFEDVSPEGAADRARNPWRPKDDWSPETAAVMVLGLACGAFGMPEPIVDYELAPVGELRWICEAVTAHLETAHRGNLRAAGAADGGSNPYF